MGYKRNTSSTTIFKYSRVASLISSLRRSCKSGLLANSNSVKVIVEEEVSNPAVKNTAAWATKTSGFLAMASFIFPVATSFFIATNISIKSLRNLPLFSLSCMTYLIVDRKKLENSGVNSLTRKSDTNLGKKNAIENSNARGMLKRKILRQCVRNSPSGFLRLLALMPNAIVAIRSTPLVIRIYWKIDQLIYDLKTRLHTTLYRMLRSHDNSIPAPEQLDSKPAKIVNLATAVSIENCFSREEHSVTTNLLQRYSQQQLSLYTTL
ncbi:hypothetical protein FF38_07380 [Lucilia cuprina]|uniref:Uncharacterized protein n=1 Tax=Lucilia cuprina TaxID=7375 RepID=A0A0L0CBT8_LUCCU|nr:hypothetical protein FF38_07380 [Lucilia cuprina]